jgi:hypothetical protein
VEGAPAVVEMLKDLEGGDVTVHHELMAELGIVLLIEGIPKVVNDAFEKVLSDEPRGPNEFPLFFHSLPCVRRGGVCDVGIVGCWFVGDSICCNVGEVVVFIDAQDVGE